MTDSEQLPVNNRKNRSLYQIRQDHLSLLAMIEENDGEITDDIVQAIQLSNIEFKDKVISYGFVIKSVEDEIGNITSEIKRLQKCKDKAEKKAAVFRDRILSGMQEFQIDNISNPIIKITIRKSNSVDLSDEFSNCILKYFSVKLEIPEHLKKEAMLAGITDDWTSFFDVKIMPNKNKISNVLQEGQIIAGARIKELNNVKIS